MKLPSGSRIAVVLALVGGGAAALPAASAQAASLTATLIATHSTAAWGRPSPDPAGITYDSTTKQLLISDSEVDEMPAYYAGTNIFVSSLTGVQSAGFPGGTSLPWSNEPTGISYRPDDTVFVSDDDLDRIFHLTRGADGRFGTADDAVTSFSTRPIGGDSEDVSVDTDVTNNGHVLVMDGVNTDIYDYGPGPNGVFDARPPTGDDTVVTIDVGQYGAKDPEGIEYVPGRNTILVLDHTSKTIYELNRQGGLLNTVSITAAGSRKAAGMTLAPASDGSDAQHLYIVDRGVDNDSNPTENDGRFYEMAVTFPPLPGGTNSAPVVSAGPDLTVTQPAAASLAGTVGDDGLPNPPGAVTATWSMAAGPGTVTFANIHAAATTATFSAPGNYLLRLTGNDGQLQSSDDVSVAVGTGSPGGGTGVLDVPVRAGSDDAEERTSSGAVTLTSTDLELVTDGTAVQTVGLRFTGITVPAGATVTNAYVQFQVDEVSTGADSVTVAGQAADNPPTFTTATQNVSSRPRTAATVPWTPAPWGSVGARGSDQRTPNLAPVVQQIVSRQSWASGNALVLVVTGSGTRTAEAFESGAALAPVLHVEYGTGSTGPTNTEPVVQAGPDLAVTQPDAATLAGSVTDDGLPSPPGAVTAAWSKVTGPGTVTFADATQASTTATFSAAGSYVLRLTCSDGALQANDEVTVTVADGGTGPVNAAPVVSAGPDVAVTRPDAATLAGSVTDDGLPASPGRVSASWSTVSGPGSVMFANINAASTTATFGAAGDYVLRLTGDDGSLQATDDVAVTVSDPAPPPGTVLEVPVRASADDAEQRTSTGAVTLTSGDLNLGTDAGRPQTVGMRFTAVGLPVGATITAAWVQFQVDEVSTGAASVTIAGEAADTAATFTATTGSLTPLPRTTATVGWVPVDWPTVGARTAAQRTPDLAPILQEIVGRPGWASGNAVVLLITGTGSRVAESFDGGADRAPVLHIEYTG